jgi:hypothetical protein
MVLNKVLLDEKISRRGDLLAVTVIFVLSSIAALNREKLLYYLRTLIARGIKFS